MSLTQLRLSFFRNFQQVSLNFHSKLNAFWGANGSGKTSILEAIYCLARGKSFRTSDFSSIIAHQQDKTTIFCEVKSSSGSFPIGLEKTRQNKSQLKLSGQTNTSISEIASLMPLQLINHDSYLLLTGGPRYRRALMDWLPFHVEQSFFYHWQCVQRALKQRNLALKRQLDNGAVLAWDQTLSDSAVLVSQYRQKQFSNVFSACVPYFNAFIGEHDYQFIYRQGWDAEVSLVECLQKSLRRDFERGSTSYGPHRATIDFFINGIHAEEVLSRGQAKVFVTLMQIAQAQLLNNHNQQDTIFLIDDLPAELDDLRRNQLFALLTEQNAQILITSIERAIAQELLEHAVGEVFHVEHL